MVPGSETDGALGTKLKDSDGTDLNFSDWYKMRFVDGTELGLGGAIVGPQPKYATMVVPPNVGVWLYFSTSSKLETREAIYIVGRVEDPNTTSTKEIYLSIDDAGAAVYWYDSSSGNYAFQADQSDGRTGLYAQDKEAKIVGLRSKLMVVSSRAYPTVVKDIIGLPLNCSFVVGRPGPH
jgi:hypothetical protein